MTAPSLDPYAILGVTAAASDDDLDHAFRGLIRQLHPDTRTPESADDADRRLQDLLNAYATLRDPIRRAAHDRALAQAAAPSTPALPTRGAQAVPIRLDPAIRIGPVRWEPAASGGTHHGTR
ncbi:J domain-containing protein [Kribbella sp. NPDC055071]